MHRLLLLALSLLPCGCSSAPASCSCCGFGSAVGTGSATFVDTDDDGLPDARVADPARAGTLDAPALDRAYRAVLTAGTIEDQRLALANLARAVADAQAAVAR